MKVPAITSNPSAGRVGTNRRQFLGTAAAVFAAAALEARPGAARGAKPFIKAVAFDAFAIFDPRSVFRLVEEIFPGRGKALSDLWRARQFEYTWLHNSMHRYTDFWRVTEDALNFAAKQSGIMLQPEERTRLMSAYLELKPWPDVPAAIRTLQKRGLRLALLSNMTNAMMQACVQASGLEGVFDFQLSTDRVKAFKPDPVSYQMGVDVFHLKRTQIAFVAFGGWDAAGAKAFGYPTYWANRLDIPAEELGVFADASYQDLSFLPSFIGSLQST